MSWLQILGKYLTWKDRDYAQKDDGSRIFNVGTDEDEHWVLDEDELAIPCYAITIETKPGQYNIYIDVMLPSSFEIIESMECCDHREAEIATEYMQVKYSPKVKVTMSSPY